MQRRSAIGVRVRSLDNRSVHRRLAHRRAAARLRGIRHWQCDFAVRSIGI